MVVRCQQLNRAHGGTVSVLFTCRYLYTGSHRVSAVSYSCKLSAKNGEEQDHLQSGNHGLPFRAWRQSCSVGSWENNRDKKTESYRLRQKGSQPTARQPKGWRRGGQSQIPGLSQVLQCKHFKGLSTFRKYSTSPLFFFLFR